MAESVPLNQTKDQETQRLHTGPDGGPMQPSALRLMPPHVLPQLVQQLQVQQVQLEMQNEELRQTQEALAQASDHYTQLYDFSPAAYLTLSDDGIIKEANLRFCTMIGIRRNLVIERRFSDFVAPQDCELLARHCADVRMMKRIRTCKLRFLPKTG